MKITPYERLQQVSTPERSATRHIDDVPDEELETLSYIKISELGGVKVHASTIAGRCQSGKSRRDAATLPTLSTGRRRTR